MIEIVLLLIVAGIPTVLALLAIDAIAGHGPANASHVNLLAMSGVHGSHSPSNS